ncbi:3410_t:CDS:2, partial [Dentiscutata heterogama]
TTATGQDRTGLRDVTSQSTSIPIRYTDLQIKSFKKVIPEEIDELVLQYHLNPGTVDKSQIPPPRALTVT